MERQHCSGDAWPLHVVMADIVNKSEVCSPCLEATGVLTIGLLIARILCASCC